MTDRLDTAAWNFTGMGPEFDQHVAAHLPGYADVQRLIALVASITVPDGGLVADLGASTGTTAAAIRDALPGRRVRFALYDNDPSMLDEAAGKVPDSDRHVVTLPCELAHTGADLTTALWLLQFLHPSDRIVTLRHARHAAAPHGAVIVAAKTRHADSRWEDVALAALDDYKAEQGVDAETRAAKTRSLRGVLHTSTDREAVGELVQSGWHSPVLLWRWHVWSVFGAWARPQQ